MGKNGLFWS